MAKAGAKKRVEANAKQLKLLQTVIGVALAVHAVVRLVLRRGSATWLTYGWFGATALLLRFCYASLSRHAAPSYGAGGELEDGGGDLAAKGAVEYYHDVIYVTAACHVLGAATDWAWLLWLVVPGFAAWKLWELVLAPYFFSGGGGEGEDEDPNMPQSRRDRRKYEREQAKKAKKGGR